MSTEYSAGAYSAEMSRDLLELSPQMPWVSDPAGNMLAVGAKWTEWTGMPREKALGQGWRAGYHPDDLAAKLPLVEEAWRTGKPYEGRSRMRCHDGSYRWVRVRAYPKLDDNGQIVRWYGLVEDIHDQVEAEERLRESEEHYRHTVELHPQMPWTSDLQGNILTADERMRERTGVDPIEARGKGWLKIAHPDDVPAIRAATAHSMATGEPYSVKYRARMADDSYRWVHAQAYPRRDAAGAIIRWYGSNTDIHEQELVQLRLAESEARLRLAQDAAGIGIWEIDLATGVVTLSPRSLELYGLPADAHDSITSIESWCEVLHPDDRAAAMAAAEHSMEAGEPLDATFRVSLPNGEVRWLQALGRTEPGPDGRPRLIGINIDVTKRVEAERAVREAEERYRLAINATGNLVYDWDTASDHIEWSEAVTTNFGYSAHCVQPTNDWWIEKLHPDDRDEVVACLCAAIEGDAPSWTAEYRLRRADGTYANIYERGSFVRDEHGKAVRMVGAMLDITERKEAEAELERAHLELLRLSRLSAMGAMASTLAHELNQPLAAAVQYLGAAEILLKRNPTDPKAREACSLAGAEAMRAGTIIRRIRNFAQGGHVARKTEDLDKLIDRSIAIVKARSDAAGVAFIKNIEADAQIVEVDAIQIEQVLTNLIRNAVEAMTDSPIRRITLSARRRHDKIDLFIADTGPGLPPEMHQNLFQPMSSSKSEGLGLGLSICRTIIEAHGGHMWAEAPDGGGAVIVVSVPAPTGAQAAA